MPRKGPRCHLHRRLYPAVAAAHRRVEYAVRAAAQPELQHCGRPNAAHAVAPAERRTRKRAAALHCPDDRHEQCAGGRGVADLRWYCGVRGNDSREAGPVGVYCVAGELILVWVV